MTAVPPGSDLLLNHDPTTLVADLLSVRTGWVPDWNRDPGGLGDGLITILSEQVAALAERLALVDQHRLTTLLDLVGASRLPASGAVTHVLLSAVQNAPGVSIPAGTRIGATAAGRSDPVEFETTDAVTVSPAALVEVHTVVPSSDTESDHSGDVVSRRPFTLFSEATPVSRDLYIGHDELLALTGRAVIDLEIGISTPAGSPVLMKWSWWDGDLWRPFAAFVPSTISAGDDDSVDGTSGLTRSGTIRLVTPYAKSVPLSLDGTTSSWIRGEVLGSLRADPVPVLSHVRISALNEHRRLRVNRRPGQGVQVWWPEHGPNLITLSVEDRTTGVRTDTAITRGASGYPEYLWPSDVAGHRVRLGVSPRDSTPNPPVSFAGVDDLTQDQHVDGAVDLVVSRGLDLDKAIADHRPADTTRTFYPLGVSPTRGTDFLFACAAATRRPGSRVTLVLSRPVTAAEEADALSGVQEGNVQEAERILNEAVQNLKSGSVGWHLDHASAVLAQTLPTLLSGDPAAWYARVRQAIIEALRGLANATSSDQTIWARVLGGLATLHAALGQNDPRPGATDAFNALSPAPRDATRILIHVAIAAEHLAEQGHVLTGPRAHAEAAVATGSDTDVQVAHQALAVAMSALLANATPFLPDQEYPDFLATDPQEFVDIVTQRLTNALAYVTAAITGAKSVADSLDNFKPFDLVRIKAPKGSTQLSPPKVAWEYHDGKRWRDLGVSGDASVIALQTSGSVSFTVPVDIAEIAIDGDQRHWMRARLSEGSFSHLRLVSWTDQSGVLNFLPVVEPRAPQLDSVQVFYSHHSTSHDATAVRGRDAHQWQDLTTDLTWPGPGAAPFAPMSEPGPTCYLGFDGDLPPGNLGIWVDIPDPDPWATPVRPIWEGYDGTTWVRLTVSDGTDGLRSPGIVSLLWPGVATTTGASVAGASGTTIRMLGTGDGLRFAPGDRLIIADLQGAEPVQVAQVSAQVVSCRDPLSRPYVAGELRDAPPARFGTPRTWIRAVFPADTAPERTIAAMVPHAVQVRQVRTVTNELLGSGDGSAYQVLTARNTPVVGGAELEVRELDGDRADLDSVSLMRTLAANHIDPDAIRLVTDQKTGRTREVWVRWSQVDALGVARAGERVYDLDSATGRFRFGGDGHGRPLPQGRDNVVIRRYQTSDGAVGNVPAHTVTTVLSAVALGEVTNPRPARGGSDLELLTETLKRAPGLMRHRRLAVTESDIADMARESSPAIARAHAMGAVDQWGRPNPGHVRVLVIPNDPAPQPTLAPDLAIAVRETVAERMPITAHVVVETPDYCPVGVSVRIQPLQQVTATEVRELVQTTIGKWLHPVTGRESDGWQIGAPVQISDLARLIGSVPGVDAVVDLELTREGSPAGDIARVGADQVVCAGPINVQLSGGA